MTQCVRQSNFCFALAHEDVYLQLYNMCIYVHTKFNGVNKYTNCGYSESVKHDLLLNISVC